MLTKSLHWNSKDDVGAVHHFVQEIRAKGNLPLMVKNYTKIYVFYYVLT